MGSEMCIRDRVKEYILEHLDESALNGEQISRHFAMSRVQLHRKLKALTDQSAGQFVKVVRLEKAFALIQEEELNLSEIAFQTGFNSLSYFSRTFKTAYGKSPSEILKVKKQTT